MKKIILMSVFVISAIALTAFTQIKFDQNTTENADCQYGQCSKIKTDGYKCKNCAQQNSAYCWSHRI